MVFKVCEHHDITCPELLKMRVEEARATLQELKEEHEKVDRAIGEEPNNWEHYQMLFGGPVFFDDLDAQEIMDMF